MSTASSATASRGELHFSGRVAIVTGAGGGLGRAYALLLAARGASVVVNDVGGSVAGMGADNRAADRVVAEINAAGGTAVADYGSVEDGDKVVATALRAFGRVDILICNAGILRDVTFGKMTAGEWEAVYRVHLLGSYRCARAAWKSMRDAHYGRIVFVTSSSGLYGNVGQANYAAAKMGILGLSNTLAREGARRNILVNTVAPIAASRMTESVMPPDLLDALKPEAVAPFVAYLCHETCPTTGGVFELGAGWISRLRWQRSAGVSLAPTGAGEGEISVEAVRDAWSKAGQFDAGASFPDSTQSAFEPILATLRSHEKGGSGGGGEVDDTAASRGVAEAVRGITRARGSGALTAPLEQHRLYLEPMPGGNVGGSDSVDVKAALAHVFKSVTHKYTERDVCLYALSVGASSSPLDRTDLQLTYEAHPEGLRTIPTFGVLFPHTLLSDITTLPSLRFNPMMLLHGEQELVLPVGAIPTSATVTTRGRITNIFDKGRGAVVIVEAVTSDMASGAIVCVNRSSIFLRGVGGFGGDRGPVAPPWTPPRIHPDASVRVAIHPTQALLYRLNGDLNPLHADPDMAALGGFDKPILHGLCTFGIAGRVILRQVCGNDGAALRSIKARFTKHVFPGETLIVQYWVGSSLSTTMGTTGTTAPSTTVWFQCKVLERDEVVLANGLAVVSQSHRAKL